MPSSQHQIKNNVDAHEAFANVYGDRHPEIYNPTEQQRLRNCLERAVELISSDGKSAMDYGCGDGNLTRHLLNLGCHVTTADVTPSFTEISSRIDPSNTTPFILNGVDMREIDENTFDFVATYSVLHHIPDYLGAIREMARVLKPGGVLYLDHERCEDFWSPNSERDSFFNRYEEHRGPSWYARRLVSPAWWSKRIKKWKDPRYQEEGDIHVWPDDHIEWPEIRNLLSSLHFDTLTDDDYLHCQLQYDLADYKSASEKFTDMRVLVARKG